MVVKACIHLRTPIGVRNFASKSKSLKRLYCTAFVTALLVGNANSAFAEWGYSVPASAVDQLTANNRFEMRLGLNRRVGGSNRGPSCRSFYIKGDDDAAAEKFQTLQAALLGGKVMHFAVDAYNTEDCHALHVTIQRY
jgi:hypothetical protein